MRPFWSPAETVIGGRSGLLRGHGRPPRPLLRPHEWSGATVSIQMGGGGAEDRGLRSVTRMGESQSRALIHSGNITRTVIDWYRGSGDSGRCPSWVFAPIDTRLGTEQTSDHWLCSISSLIQIGAKTQEGRLPEVKRIHTTQTYPYGFTHL